MFPIHIFFFISFVFRQSLSSPIKGGLTKQDFEAAKHLPESLKSLKNGTFNIDDILNDGTQAAVRSVEPYAYRRWPNAQIPYLVSSDYTSNERAVVAKAISNIETATNCVKFIPRTNEQDYIYITPDYKRGYACYSNVGRIGGQQLVKMQGDCVRESAMTHELLHAVGFGHENQRPDATDYIQINYQNIRPEFYGQNYALNTWYKTLGMPYDYESIMHYPDYAYVKQYGLKSMTPLKRGVDLSYERKYITKTDSEKMRKYYGCS